MTNDRNLEYLPKKRALAAQVEGVVIPLIDKPMSAWEDASLNHDLSLGWYDDYTLAELTVIGLAIGSNLPWGSCAEIVKAAAIHSYEGDEFGGLFETWFSETIVKPLEKGDFVTPCRELDKVSKLWALCAAIRISSDGGADITERILEVVAEAMDNGYDETNGDTQ